MSATAPGLSELRDFFFLNIFSWAVCKKGCVLGEKMQGSETFCLYWSCSSVKSNSEFVLRQRQGGTVMLRLCVWPVFFTYNKLNPVLPERSRKTALSSLPLLLNFCTHLLSVCKLVPSLRTRPLQRCTQLSGRPRKAQNHLRTAARVTLSTLAVCRGGFHMCCLLLSTRW